jgi:hypothetical protein
MNQAEKENGMDVEKTIEFLLRQQAQFSSDLSALMQQQTQFRADLAALSNTVTELTGTVTGLARNVVSLTQVVSEVVTVQERLVEGQRTTDERLNALITIVDKLISRNGSQQ